MKKKGFTLVEVLVALAIGAPVIALVLSSFLALATSAASLIHYRDMNKEARYAMAVIGRDIVTASGVEGFDENGELELNLKTESGTSSVTYSREDNKDFVQKKNSKTLILATGVESVLFELYDRDGDGPEDISKSDAYSIDVKLTMARQGVRTGYTNEIQGWYRMRNKGL